jgi:hypothetical protein
VPHLSCADLAADALGEDLGPAARQRVEPRRLQLAQHLLVGHAVEIGEERDLDRREALQVDARADPLQPAQHVGVVRERQVRVQAVDDVDLGERLVGAGPQLVEDLLERQRVGPVVARLEPRERTEEAAGDADVGRLEADVEVVVRAAAVPLLALAVGEPAERVGVGATEEADAVLEPEPRSGVQLVGDLAQPEGFDPLQHNLAIVPSAFFPQPSVLLFRCYTPGEQLTLSPAASGSGCKSHAVPPL